MGSPKKRLSCPNCNNGTATCPNCNGRGTIQTTHEGRIRCSMCNATGLIKCPTCHGTGYYLVFDDQTKQGGMYMRKCSKCAEFPVLQFDELGTIFRLCCPKCGKHTQDIISPTSTLSNPVCDENTKSRLYEEWDNMN